MNAASKRLAALTHPDDRELSVVIDKLMVNVLETSA